MRRPAGYAVAIAALVVAVALRWALNPLMGDTLPLVTVFGAVALAVFAGGYGPALIVATLGYLACLYLFIPPHFGFDFETETIVGLIAYLFTCALIIGIGEAMRIARIRAATRGELLRVTLTSIGDAVITTGNEGRVASMNDVAETLTGWTRHDAIGQPLEHVFRIINEDTRAPVESPATRALREGTVVGLANHTLLVDKHGVERAIDDSAAPIRDEAGVVSGCVLIFRDVTERRRWEKDESARLATARLLASIVESSDDAIISKSLDGVIQSWNAAAERMFGHTAAEAVGRHISLVIPRDRLTEEDEIVANLKAGRRVDHFETERVRKDGSRIQVSLTISPIKNDDGVVIGASKIARDISERKRAESELRKLAADLSEVDRRKNEFLATLAHELRNPLAPLSNALEVLKRSHPQDATLQRNFDTMDRQLAQLVRLVDDLLDLNRITHNRIELRRSHVDLAAVIRQAVQASQPLADAAGHEIEVIQSAEPILLHADPVRLAQVFGNLLNNSCKYTMRGGKIRIRAHRDGDDAVVTVDDTGIGIPPDKLHSIFDMFTQVDRSAERSQGGLGIGLTLVKRLVEMHGGSAEARSAGEGRGSEFIVRLPIEMGVRSSAPAAPSTEQVTTSGRRILVVDDNEDSAETMALLLEMSGHQTHTAHDGEAALEAAERLRPDVILLDIGLPTMSGHEVCRRIRQEPWGRQMAIIALTGWGQEEDRRRSEEAGFDGHLVKPVEPARLAALLESLTQASP